MGKKGFPGSVLGWIRDLKVDLRANSSDSLFETTYSDAKKYIKRFPREFPSIENELNEIKQLWDSI